MIEKNFLVRLDPDNRGIGYFDSWLDTVDCQYLIASHFEFLGMQLISVSTFATDFGIEFQALDLKLKISNDDATAHPEYSEGDYLDFVVFCFTGPCEEIIYETAQIVSKKYDMFEISNMETGPN